MATEPVESVDRRHWTVGDYMAIEDDQHRELIEGELRVTPSSNPTSSSSLPIVSTNCTTVTP